MRGAGETEAARVPLAMVGVALLLVATVTAAVAGAGRLAMQQAASGDAGLLDETLFAVRGDLERALNYASLAACEEVGSAPLVQPLTDVVNCTPDECDRLRLVRLSTAHFDGYLAANYPANATGTGAVSARRTGEVTFREVRAGLNRTFQHPLAPAYTSAPAYYVASVPVNVTLRTAGRCAVEVPLHLETLVTSRYPLLRALTEEYEGRLNGASPLTFDVTAGTLAYTWARGYLQYATGNPHNVVDNRHLAVMANGALLLEQAATFNAVDPMSVAHLGVETVRAVLPGGDGVEPRTELLAQVNRPWWMGHQGIGWQGDALNSTGDAAGAAEEEGRERSYTFNLSCASTLAWRDYLRADDLGRSVGAAYTTRVELQVHREVVRQEPVAPPGAGWTAQDPGPWGIDSFRVVAELRHPDAGEGVLECTAYGVERSRPHAFRSAGNETATAWERVVETVWVNVTCPAYADVAGSANDVASPFTEVTVLGRIDPNLRDAAQRYRELVGLNDSIGCDGARTLLYEVLTNNRSAYPDGTVAHRRDVVCGHNHWVERLAWDHLCAMREAVAGLNVTLREGDYPTAWDMVRHAGVLLQSMLDERRATLLGRANFTSDGLFPGAGLKAAYAAGAAYLERFADVSRWFDQSAQDLVDTIDGALEDAGAPELDAEGLADGKRRSESLLNRTFTLPLGWEVNLTFTDQPGWSEPLRISLDQSPDYLPCAYYQDNYTGYRGYPMKVKNICLFTLQVGDIVDLFIEQGFELLDEQVLSLVDALFADVEELANRTIADTVGRLAANLTRDLGNRLTDHLMARLVNDTELGPIFDREDMLKYVNDYLQRFNVTELVHQLSDGSLVDGMAEHLRAARAQVAAYLASALDGYRDEYIDYLSEKLGELAREACARAISAALKEVEGEVRQLYLEYSAALEEELKGAVDEGLSEVSGLVFSGLPIMPPFGWWLTMNVWYVEVQGDIPSLVVYDADNQPHENPLFGHQPQVYAREWREVLGTDGRLLGYDLPIQFQVKTASFILVPPGAQGVGDRTGGWEEASEGWDAG